jgi:hypothetical protein
MLWAKAVSSRLLPGLVSYYCVFDKEILIAIIPLEKRILGLWPFQIRWLQLPTHSNIYLCDVLLDKSYCGDEIIHTVLDYIYYAKSGFRWDYCKLRKFSARSALFTQIKQNDPLVRAIDECV